MLMLVLMLMVGCIGCEREQEPSGMVAGWACAGRCLRRIIFGCGGEGKQRTDERTNVRTHLAFPNEPNRKRENPS